MDGTPCDPTRIIDVWFGKDSHIAPGIFRAKVRLPKEPGTYYMRARWSSDGMDYERISTIPPRKYRPRYQRRPGRSVSR